MAAETKSAIIWARTSSSGALETRQSTTRQVEDLQDFASRNHYHVDRVFEEHISGATRLSHREVLSSAITYAKENHIHTILTTELSRIGRSDDVLYIVKECKDAGINIYFQKENLNIFQPDGTKNPFLNIFISVLGTCAELERSSIAYRLATGRKRYIENGGRLGRKMGYKKSHEKKQEEYKDVISYLRKGYPVRVTAKLTEKGISTVMRIKKEFELEPINNRKETV